MVTQVKSESGQGVPPRASMTSGVLAASGSSTVGLAGAGCSRDKEQNQDAIASR